VSGREHPLFEDVRRLASQVDVLSHDDVEMMVTSLVAFRLEGQPLPPGASMQGLGLLLLRVSQEREQLREEVVRLRALYEPINLLNPCSPT